MARDRSRSRKNHVHNPGVRCSRCRPLSKAEVAAIAPPPPERPVALSIPGKNEAEKLSGMAHRIRAASIAAAVRRQPTPKSGERGQRRVQAK